MSQRARMLAEMGIAPLWQLRSSEAPEALAETPILEPIAPPIEALAETPKAAPAARPPRPVVMPAPAVSVQTAPVRPAVAAPQLDHLDWPALNEAVRACQACGLCKARKQTVFGVGDPQADWLFVGEGPGAEEDERGEPFVGQAGKLLDAMLGSIQLQRGQDVYIANAVKCRPPGNRTPEAAEIAACHPFLERQIALIKPRLIIALGRPAAQTLLNAEVKIGAARGKTFDRQGIPVIVTYHPAYLLRNLEDKAKAWEDLCFAADQMQALRAD